MRKSIELKIWRRVVDANYNRAKEALRVCEDVCRFVLNDAGATKNFKDVRHLLTQALTVLVIKDLVAARDIKGDVGKQTTRHELVRSGAASIFYANTQRAKESIRVLEEFMKIFSPIKSRKLKDLRYRLYALEKKIASRI